MFTKKQIDHIRYTWRHRKAFRTVEKLLTGHNTVRSFFHDVDKLVGYVFKDPSEVASWHRGWAHHHEDNARTKGDFVQMVIDCECARFTKSDKPMTAYETMKSEYPHLEAKLMPILKEFDIAHEGKNWLDEPHVTNAIKKSAGLE